MEAQPKQFRGWGWASALYLIAALICAYMTVSARMDQIHGTGAFSPAAYKAICAVGLVLGAVGAVALLLRGRRSNSNFRAAILSILFGLLVFGLGFASTVDRPTASQQSATTG